MALAGRADSVDAVSLVQEAAAMHGSPNTRVVLDEDCILHSKSLSRKLLLALAVTQSSCCTGVLFGYSALASTLMRRGQYSELCENGAMAPDDGTGVGDSGDAVGVCAAQKLRFSLIYTFASTCLFSSFLAFGLIVDKYGGPRRANSIGCTLVAVGLLLLAVSDSKTLDLFPLGFAIVGLGGPGVHISLFHVALLFPPAKKNTIQSFLVGAFVLSGIAFPVERWLIENTGVSRTAVLAAHACVLSCLTIVGLRIWPDKKFTPGDSIQFHRKTLLSYAVTSGGAEQASVEPSRQGDGRSRLQKSRAANKHQDQEASHLRANEFGAHTRERAREKNASSPCESSRLAAAAAEAAEDEGQLAESTDTDANKTATEACIDVGSCSGGDGEERVGGAGGSVGGEAGVAATSCLRPGCTHLHALSLREQLCTEEYRRLAIFMMIHALHFNFYLGTFPQQITSVYQRELQGSSSVGNSSASSTAPAEASARAPPTREPAAEGDLTAVIQTFSLSLAVMMPSAVVTLPCVGRLLDSYSLRSGGFLACNVTGVLYGALVLAPYLSVQWLTMAALSVHRMLLFSSLFAYTGSRSPLLFFPFSFLFSSARFGAAAAAAPLPLCLPAPWCFLYQHAHLEISRFKGVGGAFLKLTFLDRN